MQIGPYEILEEIARGGMGAVYRARHQDHERVVALKVLLAGPLATERQRRRFQREAQAVSKLKHPNLVQVFDVGEDGSTLYLVMQWVAGESLQERLDRAGPLPVAEALRLVREVSGAVSHAHQRGVLHRDLKPANVMLTSSGTPLLTDFGLAGELDPSLSRSRLTQEGHFLGTPGYWAPEQARGDLELLSEATDVYGLGALLYGLLTGQPPGREGLVEALHPRAPTSPSQLNPSVPAWLDHVVAVALREDPGQRYPSCEALADALTEGAGGLPGRSRLLLLVAGALVLGAAGISTWMRAQSAEAPPSRSPTAVATSSASASPVATASVGEPLVDVTELLARGVALRKAGDFEAAAKAYSEALRREPRSAKAYAGRGNARRMLGDLRGQIEDLSHSIRLRPDPLELLNRGSTWARLNELEAALSDFNWAIELVVDRADAYLLRGRVRELLGDEPGARADYDQAVRRDPELAESSTLRGDLFAQRLGDVRGAIDAHSRAIELGRLPPRMLAYALRRRGSLRVDSGDEAGAFEDYTRALQIEPDVPTAQARLAKLHLDRGELDPALARYTRAIELGLDDPVVYSNRGDIRTRLGDLAGAVEDTTEAIALDADFPEAYATRGEARHKQGDLEGAIADYERALELAPADAEWTPLIRRPLEEARQALQGAPEHFARGLALGKAGDWRGAVEAYDRALQLDSSRVRSHFNRAHALSQVGDLEGAIAGYSDFLQLRPGDAAGLMNRGLARGRYGDWAAAIEDFDAALRTRPDDALTYFNRGVAWASLQEWSRAEEDCSRAIELDPELAGVHAERARARYRLGDQEGSILDYSEAIRRDPADMLTHVALADLYLSLDELGPARASYTRAIELGTNDPAVYSNRAHIRSVQGDLAGAIEDTTQALALNAELPEAYATRGEALHKRGDLEQAVADYERALELAPVDAAWAPELRRALGEARQALQE